MRCIALITDFGYEDYFVGALKGIIWHTQGSGKTALAFYNVHYLTDYYQRKRIIPKFHHLCKRYLIPKSTGLSSRRYLFRRRGGVPPPSNGFETESAGGGTPPLVESKII